MGSLCLIVLGALATLSASACAATITYTESAIGSGTFDGSMFNNALITFNALGDTANVTHNSGTVYFSTVTTTITIAGLHTDTLTDIIAIASNQGLAVAALSDITTDYVIQGTANPVFGTYDLTTALGPVSGANFANTGRAFTTSGGSFTLGSIDGDSTFQAAIANTPEPSSLVLIATGSLGLAGAVRRRLRPLNRLNRNTSTASA